MPAPSPTPWPTKVASLALPTRESHVVASVWPRPEGTLLFLAELNLAQPARQELTLALTQAVEQAWSNLGGADDAESMLEQIILQVNPVLKAHERSFGNPLAPRYHLALALLQQPALALSHLGHLSALVVNGNQATNIFGQQPRHASTPTFEHLMGGNLEPGETLVLTTGSLFDYVALEKLTGLLKLHSPGLALREVEQTISALEHHPSVGLIALRLGEAAEQNPGTDNSIQHLLATQANTSSLLKPTVWSWLKGRAKPFSTNPQPRPTVEHEPRVAEPGVEETYTPRRGQRAPTSWYRRLTRLLGKLSWLRSRESAKATIAWWLEGKLNAWRNAPTVKKVLLVLAVMVLAAFSQSIVTMGRGRLQAQDSDRYNQQVTAITENQAALEGALIYHDDVKAQELLTTTENLLAALPRNTSSREQQYQALSQSLALLQQRLSHTTAVRNLTALVTLPNLSPGAHWQNVNLVAGSVVAVATSGEVALLTTDGKPSGGLKLPADFGTVATSVPLDSALLVTSQTGKQVLVDPHSKAVTAIDKPVAMVDGAFYQGRFYYLGTSPSTIWRTSQTGTSFATPNRWLKTNQGELTGASSLTVDGYIYVSVNSTVEKFVLGTKRAFTLEQLTPPLQHIDAVRTTSDTDNLYLMSYSDKRLAIYDKQGKLVIQLTFPDLPQLTGVSVDGQSKTLYLLSGTNIYYLKLSDYTPS